MQSHVNCLYQFLSISTLDSDSENLTGNNMRQGFYKGLSVAPKLFLKEKIIRRTAELFVQVV